MTILETSLTEDAVSRLIDLSRDWENEGSCHGYRANTSDDLEGRRIFLAMEDGQIWGYLFGKMETANKTNSIITEGTPFFELEELYVRPAVRSKGIGRKMFFHVEEVLTQEGVPFLFLSTATKNWKAILHFYLDELDMEFWNARLFKRLNLRNDHLL